MTKQIKMKLATALVLTGALFCASAEDVKVGYVNFERIFQESNIAVAAQNKLKQDFSKRDKDLMDLTNTLKSDAEKFERDGPTMSDSQRLARQRQLVEQDREIQRKRQELQEDIKIRSNEENKILYDKLSKVIKQIADSEKYDLLLNQAAYINPKLDVTDKVIKALNANK